MPMRFRRSISLGKRVRMNVSKTGLGISGWRRSARYCVHNRQEPHIAAAVVGSPSRRRDVVVPAPSFAAVLPTPAWLSSRADKRYHAGVHGLPARLITGRRSANSTVPMASRSVTS